jgi:hypothetical protein
MNGSHPAQIRRTFNLVHSSTGDIDDEAALKSLGDKLQLPQGWSYKVVQLTDDVVITINGKTTITPDNLDNKYDLCEKPDCSNIPK